MDRRRGSEIQTEESQSSDYGTVESEENLAEMAPVYVFLASSLNVELVYIILTSISKFSHL